ncbi:hypothetical protein fugu_012811 [Takifugu bimaculatus]|uniref:Family with sequence similarity 98 member A n=1 Tax=Takifugu bimaculatus TaxID=433685 RepID=A0A4Z2C6J9_9TELE|nr:hypothetical protein fugu_012811 [Takifugu bimaculatus]
MDNEILVSLEDLGYQGPLLEDGALECAAMGGAPSPEYTKLCAWIVSELKLYCKLEENVHATNSPSEAESFQLEMSGLLSELACPYPVLVTGDITQRFLNKDDCLLLLTFLVSELEASRMILVNKPQKKAQESGSAVFQELKAVCLVLGMSKPPANITMFQFFSGIEKKLKEVLSRVPSSHIGDPLMKKPLGPVHLEKIEAINQALINDYDARRKMLLKRLDVTVQSFGWSDRAKTRTEQLAKVYQPLRSVLVSRSRISVAHLLAARQDFSKILRTSSGKIREKTACAINKRCLPGRNVRMLPMGEGTTERNMAELGTGVGEGATSSTTKVAEGDTREEVEGKETGEAEAEEQEGATTRVEEEETTRATFRTLGTMEAVVTMTTITRMEAGITRGAGVEDLGEGGDAVVEEEVGWGGRGGQNLNQGGQFEQFFQYGGQQYSQAGFNQPRYYTS